MYNNINAVAQSTRIYASGFTKNTTCEEIREHAKQFVDNIGRIELLPDREGFNCNAFAITISKDMMITLIDPKLWPPGITVGHFKYHAYIARVKRTNKPLE